MKSLDLRGLVPAPVTPFTRDGAVDHVAIKRLGAWLGSFKEVKGLTVLGHAEPIYPYDGPTLFSMPAAFLVTFIVSKLDKSARAKAEIAAFPDQYVRAHTGYGAATAVSH